MPELRDKADLDFAQRLNSFCQAELPVREGESEAHRRQRIIAASKRIDLYYMTQPADYGGKPGTLVQLTLARETLAAARAPGAMAAFGPTPGVLAGCDEPLRSTHLKPLMNGDKRAAFAFTEADDAPRPSWAKRSGDYYIVNGAKSYVTGGAHADFMNALIQIDDEGGAMMVIDTNAAGVTATRKFTSIDGSHHMAFTFKNVQVPIEHVIGKPGEGLPRALRQIGDTRLLIAATCTGISGWVLDYLTDHLQKPHRGGKPLAGLESVRLRYAQLRIDAYAARSMLYRTARLGDAGENIVNESIACKVFATESVARIVDEAIQLVGGQALTNNHPLAELYKEVRSYKLTEGASDVLRLNLARGRLDLAKGRI